MSKSAAQDEVLSCKAPMAKFTLEDEALPVRRTEPTEPLLAAHELASELPAAKLLLPDEEFGPAPMDKTRLYGAVLALQLKTATEIHEPPYEAELSGPTEPMFTGARVPHVRFVIQQVMLSQPDAQFKRTTELS